MMNLLHILNIEIVCSWYQEMFALSFYKETRFLEIMPLTKHGKKEFGDSSLSVPNSQSSSATKW